MQQRMEVCRKDKLPWMKGRNEGDCQDVIGAAEIHARKQRARKERTQLVRQEQEENKRRRLIIRTIQNKTRSGPGVSR